HGLEGPVVDGPTDQIDFPLLGQRGKHVPQALVQRADGLPAAENGNDDADQCTHASHPAPLRRNAGASGPVHASRSSTLTWWSKGGCGCGYSRYPSKHIHLTATPASRDRCPSS